MLPDCKIELLHWNNPQASLRRFFDWNILISGLCLATSLHSRCVGPISITGSGATGVILTEIFSPIYCWDETSFISILQQQQPSILNPLTAHSPGPHYKYSFTIMEPPAPLWSSLSLCILLSVRSGLVVSCLVEYLDRGSDHHLLITTRPPLDICRPQTYHQELEQEQEQDAINFDWKFLLYCLRKCLTLRLEV